MGYLGQQKDLRTVLKLENLMVDETKRFGLGHR